MHQPLEADVIYLAMADGSRAEVRDACAAEVVGGRLVCMDESGLTVARFDSGQASVYAIAESGSRKTANEHVIGGDTGTEKGPQALVIAITDRRRNWAIANP
jgi:hypothetical protein